MADRTPRLLPASYNLAILAGTVITASSYDTSFPVAWLRSANPTKRWRSKLGWTIVAGFNDKIDFNRGGVKVATIAAGYYAGAALATAIVTALEAADATPIWASVYDTSTKKVTISSDLAFVLLFGTGTNIATGAGKDLGYAVADTASATSQTAGSAAYQSRAYILFDLGAAAAATVGIAHGHNMASGGTVTLYGKTASNPWVTPGTTQALAGDDLANKRILFFGSQSFRYWALVFDDVQNTAGYNELGVPFIGTYFEPARGYQIGATRGAVPLTEFARAVEGALQVNPRNAPKQHAMTFSAVSETDTATYQTIEDTHGRVFLAKDPQNYSGSKTIYGAITSQAQVREMSGPGGLYVFDVVVDEDLG